MHDKPTAAEQPPGSTLTLLDGADGAGPVLRTVLPGGLRVVTEFLPGVRSAALGVWAAVGSRDEDAVHAGSTHFLEHLLFKGTRRRTAMEIASLMDAVGAEHNAFTGKEYTCYYARVLDADLPLAVDVLGDMLTGSVLEPREVEAEREVILEEIAMVDDEPGDLVHDLFAETLFGDSPLGWPILGTPETIGRLGRDRIMEHYRARYRPADLVVAVAGNVEHDAVVDQVRAAFAPALGAAEAAGALPCGPRLGTEPDPARTAVQVRSRTTEQAHLVLGGTGLARTDDRRFALGVLNAALGGGMSSRLFQEVREKRGLAYSIYSFTSGYADTGSFAVATDCQPAKIDDVLAVCLDQIGDVAAHGITEEELVRGKGQVRGSFVLGLEDPQSRMSRLAKSELVYGTLPSVGELLGRIDAVSADDVRAIAADVLARPRSLAVIGPYHADREFAV
ncbi:M16 family metallopeptidase [Allonocardiopsis opalescens]|uniref:M16 family metallopeptidase n=1 Tax=Allonocardiopsis opalescens TaxID=1144618 RepID=UPI001B803D62|nr:pitrilysin family protein [Allonocardiopsis opalescens]